MFGDDIHIPMQHTPIVVIRRQARVYSSVVSCDVSNIELSVLITVATA